MKNGLLIATINTSFGAGGGVCLDNKQERGTARRFLVDHGLIYSVGELRALAIYDFFYVLCSRRRGEGV